MTIDFHPKPGQVLICNFETGFVPPEMVKPRRVVVISPARLNKHLCRIVPVSTTPPDQELAHHCRFEPGAYPFFNKHVPCWIKGDMVTCVSLQRLDRLRIGNQFLTPYLSSHDYQRVMRAVMSGLAQALTDGS